MEYTPIHYEVSTRSKSNRVHILPATQSIFALYKNTVLCSLYFTIFQRCCYILTSYTTAVSHAFLEDGYIRWPKHVGVTSLFELMQQFGIGLILFIYAFCTDDV
jgi:hypothetical protein